MALALALRSTLLPCAKVFSLRPGRWVLGAQAQEAQLPRSLAQLHHIPAVRPSASFWNFPCLSLFICKKRIIITTVPYLTGVLWGSTESSYKFMRTGQAPLEIARVPLQSTVIKPASSPDCFYGGGCCSQFVKKTTTPVKCKTETHNAIPEPASHCSTGVGYYYYFRLIQSSRVFNSQLASHSERGLYCLPKPRPVVSGPCSDLWTSRSPCAGLPPPDGTCTRPSSLLFLIHIYPPCALICWGKWKKPANSNEGANGWTC